MGRGAVGRGGTTQQWGFPARRGADGATGRLIRFLNHDMKESVTGIAGAI